MTKSTITRERLQEIAEDGFLKHGESKELSRMALAAMDSEPMAWTDEEELRDANESGSGYLFGIERDANKFADPRRQIMLYRHAQPAPERDQVRSEHAEWSQATFGNVGPVGPLKHLSKEALEAAAEPGDLSEWADMQFLLWDAQRRAGITDEQITQAMIEKLVVNKQREWPEPKDGEPRLHIKAQPAPVVPDAATAIRACLSEFPESARDIVEECADIAENACRSALLQDEPVTTANKLGNSPEIPDGWKLVPVEPNGDMLAAAQDAYGETDGDIASTLRAAIAAAQPAPTIQVTDAMAYAFHHALTDGPLGDEDVEDIKTGLRASFATVTIKQPEPVVPVEATIDNKPNSSYEWRKGWNACLAAMLAVAPPAPKSTVK